MQKKKSPGWHQGNEKKETRTAPFYPASPASVNEKCPSCLYLRRTETARHHRLFCQFTGETVEPGDGCGFWTAKLYKFIGGV